MSLSFLDKNQDSVNKSKVDTSNLDKTIENIKNMTVIEEEPSNLRATEGKQESESRQSEVNSPRGKTQTDMTYQNSSMKEYKLVV